MLGQRRVGLVRLAIDLGLILASGYISFFVLFDVGQILVSSPYFYLIVSGFILLRVAMLVGMRVYDAIWRYISVQDALRLAKAVTISSIVIVGISSFSLYLNQIPKGAFFVNFLLLLTSMSAVRVLRRCLYEYGNRISKRQSDRLTLIYGAGTNGCTLANRFRSDQHLGVTLVGFIDDDPSKVGFTVAGFKVLGSMKDLPKTIKEYKIKELIISSSNLPGATLIEILHLAQENNIRPRMIADLQFTERGTHRIELARDVELDDLLKRPSPQMDLQSVSEFLKDKRILITGAGGSIGSEIAKQCLGFSPSRLILMDNSEYNLYSIDNELRVSTFDTSLIVPVLGDLKDAHAVSEIMGKYRPEVVFHAAAYKHVHLVELNPFAAILNNISGTKNLLDACEANQVESFVLISTDKAVNPVGVMGATKKVCELMVLGVARKTKKKYCAVRFGNVLGSSGSLIPLLKKQIRGGGPVTVTHAEMTRYFMLIREAVALVLKAGSISKPGDISILRMGDPLKIVDIAKRLITLLGRTEKEIPIVYTGMRPGERMHEELYYNGDELNTEHPDILVLPMGGTKASISFTDYNVVSAAVNDLVQMAKRSEQQALVDLMTIARSNQGIVLPTPKSTHSISAPEAEIEAVGAGTALN